MNIGAYYPYKNITFEAARLNILATSDNHGRVNDLPAYYDTLENNSKEIFPEKEKNSTFNLFAVAGDWSMNTAKKGLMSNPKKTIGQVHFEILNKFIFLLKNKIIGCKKQNFETVFSPGNHDLDGGLTLFLKLIQNGDFKTILSNAKLKELKPYEKKLVKNSEIITIPDDKIKNKTHKILVMGILTPSIDFYNPGLSKKLDLFDRNKEVDLVKQTEMLKDTFDEAQKQIDNFKKTNPNGKVVIMSHCGNYISADIANKVTGIDLILNGHDHKKTQQTVNNVPIISLNKDCKEVIGVSMYIDDNDKIKIQEPKRFEVQKNNIKNSNPILEEIRNKFWKDEKPLLYISAPEEFELDGIRSKNNNLANFVTDSILAEMKKKDPELQILAIPSTTFRGTLYEDSTNLDILNLLSGAEESMSKILTGKMKGSDIANLIIDNVAENFVNEEKNAIIQWSGVKINKKLLKEENDKNPQLLNNILNSNNKNKYKELIGKAIQIKDKDGIYRPIELNSTYKTALPNKFFLKDTYCKQIKNYKDRMKDTNITLSDAFRGYLEQHDFSININKFEKDRIVT